MDKSVIKSRFYTDTFGDADYNMDLEKNIGFRTPFLDEDAENSKKMFDIIQECYR